MNIEQLKSSGRVIFEAVAGSQAYGTSTPTSDVDIRGIFVMPRTGRMSLFLRCEEVNGQKQDEKYFELAKFVKLASECNPNIIELLWTPADCIRVFSDAMRTLWDNRGLFVSSRAFHTFSGYAYAQIKKARGQNKMVYNPQPEAVPVKEDFCFIVPTEWAAHDMPARPIPLAGSGIDLARCHAAALEHTQHVYRLYHYGDKSLGVFRGDDTLACESIPVGDENGRFLCLMIYNKTAFDSALREWHRYWDWKRNRNEQRWIDQENGQLDYDAKNLMHCMRLLLSGMSILKTGEPIVRFDGERLDLLRSIRAGKYPYDEIMARVETMMEEMHTLKESTSLPHSPDYDAIDKLYLRIVESMP
jgi:hypothetical protein